MSSVASMISAFHEVVLRLLIHKEQEALVAHTVYNHSLSFATPTVSLLVTCAQVLATFMSLLWLPFLVILVVICVIRRYTFSRLPPGPRGLPIVGNILDMPTTKPWLTFARWSELYGQYCLVAELYLI